MTLGIDGVEASCAPAMAPQAEARNNPSRIGVVFMGRASWAYSEIARGGWELIGIWRCGNAGAPSRANAMRGSGLSKGDYRKFGGKCSPGWPAEIDFAGCASAR